MVLLILPKIEFLLLKSSLWFCNTPVFILQIINCLTIFFLGIGWYFAFKVRQKCLKLVQKEERLHQNLANGKSKNNELLNFNNNNFPNVSVVLPIKGCDEHSLNNWKTQINSVYDGKIEYIFVLEDQNDCAYEEINSLIKYLDKLENRIVKIIFSGKAKISSQKIHNQIVGIESINRNSKYILFLDNDISIFPKTISSFVNTMEANSNIFLITGYPFDIPTNNLISYCYSAFHLILVIAFSSGSKTSFVWGGCMMLRTLDFFSDRFKIYSILKKSYSDDMTLGAIAIDNKQDIFVPMNAIFPHALSSNLNLSKFLNYLRRQMFALFTYSSFQNKIINQSLFIVHSFLSISFVLPFLPFLLHLLHFFTKLLFLLFHHRRFDFDFEYRKNGQHNDTCQMGINLSMLMLTCFVFSQFCLFLMIQTILDLCHALDSSKPKISIKIFHWLRVWFGLWFMNFCYPFCALFTYIIPYIEWSNVRYTRKHGKIVLVEHLDEASNEINDKKFSKFKI